MPNYICSPSFREDFCESGGTLGHPHEAVNLEKEEERGWRQELLCSLSISIDLHSVDLQFRWGLGYDLMWLNRSFSFSEVDFPDL